MVKVLVSCLSVLSLLVFGKWCANMADAQQVVKDGLVSFWTFDEADISGDTVKDVVGPNSGEMQTGPKIVPGKIKQALEFDGASSFVDCGNDESLNLTDALTIELWMKPNSVGEGGNNAGPICKAISGGSWAWQLRYNAPTGNFMGFQFNAGGSKWITVQKKLAADEWYHVTGTYNGSDAVCYLNGVETERLAIPAISSSPDPLLIGQDGWVNVFNGAVDEVRIYNRALTPAEVMQNFNSRSQLAVAPEDKLAITWAEAKR